MAWIEAEAVIEKHAGIPADGPAADGATCVVVEQAAEAIGATEVEVVETAAGLNALEQAGSVVIEAIPCALPCAPCPCFGKAQAITRRVGRQWVGPSGDLHELCGVRKALEGLEKESDSLGSKDHAVFEYDDAIVILQ